MLSATMKTPIGLSYPLMASPKLDGVRAVVFCGKLVSRSLKPIRNKFTAQRFSVPFLEGLDGELLAGEHDATVFRRTQSAQSAIEGSPDLTLWAFDIFGLSAPFKDRYAHLCSWAGSGKLPPHVKVVPHVWLQNQYELLAYEQECLDAGYEGIMLRDPEGPYKEGRSTLNEGYLMKVKRFEDAEAEIIGFEERMHNGNAATTNALGNTERTSHKEFLTGRGDLGALLVRGLNGPYTGCKFSIGTGFDDNDRDHIWAHREFKLHKVVKYKYFPMGSKDAPRFPVFLGFRELDT